MTCLKNLINHKKFLTLAHGYQMAMNLVESSMLSCKTQFADAESFITELQMETDPQERRLFIAQETGNLGRITLFSIE